MRKIVFFALLSIALHNVAYSQKLKKIKKVDSRAKTFESYEVLKDNYNIKQGEYLFRFAGHVQAQGLYSNNVKTGEWIYTPGDNLKIVGSYSENQKDGEWKYYKNNKLISILNYDHGEKIGKSLGYHENGTLACEYEHIDGKIFGLRKAYFDNGLLKSVINYKNGKYDGVYQMYSRSGELMYTINYKEGVPYNLDVKTEYTDSILIGGNLTNGNGEFIIYKQQNEKKQVLLIRAYKNGALNGRFEGYNHKGELSYRGQYMNGYMVGMWNFDVDNPGKRKDVAYNLSDSMITDSTKFALSKGNSVYEYSDKMPKFDKGSSDQFRYFISSILTYPYNAKVSKIEGKVYTNFIINQIGELKNAKVIDGVNPYFDKEALRVISLSPYWIPGFQDQVPVNVRFTFPIVFKIK